MIFRWYSAAGAHPVAKWLLAIRATLLVAVAALPELTRGQSQCCYCPEVGCVRCRASRDTCVAASQGSTMGMFGGCNFGEHCESCDNGQVACAPPGPEDCASLFCVADVCCNEPCDGPMERCDLGGMLGLCVMVTPTATPTPTRTPVPLMQRRVFHSATRLADGTVLVVGGSDSRPISADTVLSRATRSWWSGGSARTPRATTRISGGRRSSM